MTATAGPNATTSTRWWWKKSSGRGGSKKTAPSIKSSVPSSINGADENASMFSLYSYGESLLATSSVHNIPSSIYAQHTKSEYSGISDVDSTASILSKPWISRNVINSENDQPLKQDITKNVFDEEDIDSLKSESFSKENNTSSSQIIDFSKISMQEENDHPTSSSPIRRGSLVDYIVKKPLHGKIRAGFGRLVGNKNHNHSDGSQQQELSSSAPSSAAIRRRSYG
ncbi:hypothetical protein [Parasitella parasitica]|uniref:Uncharacterized protein n=1 Tax=Parasitella parasitica TaxID=35722 RepID=A0A0B7MWT2_9FUNG|nr:hypothetical protein [Parasitella parasitica]